MRYRFNIKVIDYKELAEWTKKRKWDIIFCEGEQADYLPFQPLIELKGVTGKVSKEMIYYRSDSPHKIPQQLSIF